MRRPMRAQLVLALLLAAGCVLAWTQDLPNQTLNNVVAVGWTNGKIVLATLAKPVDRLEWRFREIPFFPPDTAIVDVELSADATKALVVLGDGSPRVLDLTERITQVNLAGAIASQHRLLHQLFPYLANGKVCLFDDLGHSVDRPCEEASAAVIHEDGRVLYAHADGRLVIVSPGSARAEELPHRLPPGAKVRLLSGSRGDQRDFLVLVTEPAGERGLSSVSTTTIIDPREPDQPLGHFADANVAALHALEELGTKATVNEQAETGDSPALETLATHLRYPINGSPIIDQISDQTDHQAKDQTHSEEFHWSFYRVSANTDLYAPVLEFADKEPVYPSDVDIWPEITSRAQGTSRRDYEALYASLGNQRWSRCTSYVRMLSYPGTWLIEYWFYYPFDEGKSGPHLHDSEHMFIEVDKLGGTVRDVFASDHDAMVANNLYSTLVKGSPPVTLPLFATVEFGKHAMAPDLNHEGRFERGVDDNLHSYSVWGLRDRTSKVHFMMEPYQSYMSFPRNREGRFALADEKSFFPDVDVPSDHLVCRLQPFPEETVSTSGKGVNEGANREAGIEYLQRNPDAKNPEHIYKPFVVPWRELRAGVGIYDWSESREKISLGMVGDFRHMTGGLLPIPARLTLEFAWRPTRASIPINLGGENRYVFSKPTLFAGIGAERLVSNTQGFYFETTPRWVNITESVINGSVSPSSSHWQYGGLSYHLGYVLELPSARKGNFTNYIGVVIREDPAFPILFEWRVSLGFLRQRGRHDFGAHQADRNPYE